MPSDETARDAIRQNARDAIRQNGARCHRTHIAYEHFRFYHAARVLARNVGLAVAVGGFLLAVSAMINALRTPRHPPLVLHS
jgi:hypothetical protein